MDDVQSQIKTAELLVARLERLSADSVWAHQASGLRGSLLKWLERLSDNQAAPLDGQQLAVLGQLERQGFHILENAAREI